MHLYFHLPFFSLIANPRLDLLRVGSSVFHKLLLVFGGCSTTSPTSPGFKENDLKTKKISMEQQQLKGQRSECSTGTFAFTLFILQIVSVLLQLFSSRTRRGYFIFLGGCASAPLGEIDLFSCGNSGIQWSSL